MPGQEDTIACGIMNIIINMTITDYFNVENKDIWHYDHFGNVYIATSIDQEDHSNKIRDSITSCCILNMLLKCLLMCILCIGKYLINDM